MGEIDGNDLLRKVEGAQRWCRVLHQHADQHRQEGVRLLSLAWEGCGRESVRVAWASALEAASVIDMSAGAWMLAADAYAKALCAVDPAVAAMYAEQGDRLAKDAVQAVERQSPVIRQATLDRTRATNSARSREVPQ